MGGEEEEEEEDEYDVDCGDGPWGRVGRWANVDAAVPAVPPVPPSDGCDVCGVWGLVNGGNMAMTRRGDKGV